jgi:hypothetical protein
MIKKTITFEDFDGNSVTEDHYFHLSKKELVDLEMSETGGLSSRLEQVTRSNNGQEIMSTFTWLISKAYGQRDPHNPTKFFKSDKITQEFMTGPAFDQFFTDLVTHPETAAEFVNGLFPKDLAKLVEKAQASGSTVEQIVSSVGTPSTYYEEDQRSGLQHPRNSEDVLLPWAFRKPTNSELREMSREQLVDVHNRISSGWEPLL